MADESIDRQKERFQADTEAAGTTATATTA